MPIPRLHLFELETRSWVALVFLFLLDPGTVAAQDTTTAAEGRDEHTPQRYHVAPATSPIKVDAVLDEPAWRDAVVITIPYEWAPGDNTPAPVETECRVTYDLENLYLACRAFDPKPAEIRAHLADRDAGTLGRDDHLVFVLDTFNDQRQGYRFHVNPYGVQTDAFGLFQGGRQGSRAWDGIWASSGRITHEGYVVELAIPFSSLSFPRADTTLTWGFAVARNYPRSIRHRLRSFFTDRKNACLLCQADKLVGFQGIEPGRNLEFNPTLTAGRTDARDSLGAASLTSGELDAQPGLNVRWRLTSNLTVDATINPDFSQVEADAAQLEVNRRFALFFLEKRPFFLEGADLFRIAVGPALVYTRKVVDPIAGLKLTGKVGRSALGVFVAHDEVNSLLFPSSQFSRSTLLEAEVTTGVIRYRHDVGRSSSLGVLYTGREAPGYHNRVVNADGFLRISRSNALSFMYAYSDTDYPDAAAEQFGQSVGAFRDDVFELGFEHASRDWEVFAGYRDVGADFRADAGFIRRVGFRGPFWFVRRNIWGSGDKWFRRLRFGASGNRLEDHQGQLLEQAIRARFVYEGPLQSRPAADFAILKRFFNGTVFDLRRYGGEFLLQPSGDVRLRLRVDFGDEIDFQNSRKADLVRLRPGAELRLGAHLYLNLSHRLERLSLSGEKIFTVNLSDAQIIYHFSTRAFVRAIVQYRDLSRNPALYERPVTKETQRLFTQALFSYKLNPRTVFFLGYSDNWLGVTETDVTQMDRSVFMKLGYAWQP